MKKGTVVGHEIMGVIDQVGKALKSIKEGDRVVLPFNIACGYCLNCHRGHTQAGLKMNPEGVSAGYGYAGMGPCQSGQAEFVLAPTPISIALSCQMCQEINGKTTSCCCLMYFQLLSTLSSQHRESEEATYVSSLLSKSTNDKTRRLA